jgi:signal transduction histidine kinase
MLRRFLERMTSPGPGVRLGLQVAAMGCVLIMATAAIVAVRGRASREEASQLAIVQLSSAVYAESALAATALADRHLSVADRAERKHLDTQIAHSLGRLRQLRHARTVEITALRFDRAVEHIMELLMRGRFAAAHAVDVDELDPSAVAFDRDLALASSAAGKSAAHQRQLADWASIVIALLAVGGLLFFGRRVLVAERRHAREAARAAGTREVEAEIRQAQKMDSVGRLAAGVAHDFNNLLTGVIGYTSFVLGRLPEEDVNRRPLEAVVESAQRAAVLTKQLLAYGRKQDLNPSAFGCLALIDGMGGIIEGVVRENVEVTYIVSEDVQVFAEKSQLEQVVLNLIVNAGDAMPGGGHLTVALERVELEAGLAAHNERLAPGSYALLSVTDTGIGMDAGTVDKVFDPYFTTKGDDGHGLGLSTATGMIGQSGGLMTVTSTRGVGTTFSIYLPAVKGPPRIVSNPLKGEASQHVASLPISV